MHPTPLLFLLFLTLIYPVSDSLHQPFSQYSINDASGYYEQVLIWGLGLGNQIFCHFFYLTTLHARRPHCLSYTSVSLSSF